MPSIFLFFTPVGTAFCLPAAGGRRSANSTSPQPIRPVIPPALSTVEGNPPRQTRDLLFSWVCSAGILPALEFVAAGFIPPLRISSLCLSPNNLEGAPPLVCKGGLLRSNATILLFFGFVAPGLSRRLRLSSLCLSPNNLEGAPPLASKGGFLRSHVANFLPSNSWGCSGQPSGWFLSFSCALYRRHRVYPELRRAGYRVCCCSIGFSLCSWVPLLLNS